MTCLNWRYVIVFNGEIYNFIELRKDLKAQGYELEVLAGYEKHLQACEVPQVELSLLPIVPGAPLIHDVLAYLSTRSFVMFDVDELIRSPSDGAVWQIDALFCHEVSPLRSRRAWR